MLETVHSHPKERISCMLLFSSSSIRITVQCTSTANILNYDQENIVNIS